MNTFQKKCYTDITNRLYIPKINIQPQKQKTELSARLKKVYNDTSLSRRILTCMRKKIEKTQPLCKRHIAAYHFYNAVARKAGERTRMDGSQRCGKYAKSDIDNQ